jgi:hypothetical protein
VTPAENRSQGERAVPDDAVENRDDVLREVVRGLARRHPSGGMVVERAAILAAGADCSAVVAWITAHSGEPEAAIASSGGGLHGTRPSDTSHLPPVRYVLPAGALT